MSHYTAIVGSVWARAASKRSTAVCVVLVLAACGQKGNLVLPTEAAAKDRATLPQTLIPGRGAATPPPATSATVPAASASATR